MIFRRKRPNRSVTLYTRPGCHLCAEARQLLDRLARRYPTTIQEIDISTDAALYREYDIRIPVIVVDGKISLEAPIDEAKLQRAIKTGA